MPNQFRRVFPKGELARELSEPAQENGPASPALRAARRSADAIDYRWLASNGRVGASTPFLQAGVRAADDSRPKCASQTSSQGRAVRPERSEPRSGALYGSAGRCNAGHLGAHSWVSERDSSSPVRWGAPGSLRSPKLTGQPGRGGGGGRRQTRPGGRPAGYASLGGRPPGDAAGRLTPAPCGQQSGAATSRRGGDHRS